MRIRSAAGVLSLALLCVAPIPGRAADKGSSIREGTRLLEEGDRLADKGQYTDAVIRYKRAFESILPQLRRTSWAEQGRAGDGG